LNGDIGRILQGRGEVRDDVLVAIVAAASYNADIGKDGFMSKAIDACVEGVIDKELRTKS
jgi:hypothetical protein